MNTLVLIAEYPRSMPWSTTAWIPRLASAFAEQGLGVVVLCDGVEDRAIFGSSPLIDVVVRRPLRRLRAADPLGFSAWAAARLRELPAARTVSFTLYTPGDVWIPLGERVVSSLARAWRSHRPATAAMELLHRPWAAQAVLAERRARRSARDGESQVARLGLAPAFDGRPNSATYLGLASVVQPLTAEARAAARDQIRTLLGIPHGALVAVTSAVHADRDGLAAMLAGVARADLGPDSRLLLLGRKTHTLARLSERSRLGNRALVLGSTRDMAAVLAASDVALAPAASPDARSTGRFMADALRCGVPVVASPYAAGSSVLRAGPGQAAAGLVVENASPVAWSSSLSTASSAAWRAIASARATSLGQEFTVAAVAGRILALLRQPASYA